MTAYSIGGYRVDLLTRVGVDLTATASGDRLEDGARYTDHVERNPDALKIEGVISDDPMGDLIDVRAAEAEDAGPGAQYRPTAFARAKLRQLIDAGQPIDVRVAHETFERYFLETVSYEEGFRALRFSAQLKQARTVSLTREFVRLPTAAPRARGVVNLGIDPVSGLVDGIRRSAKEALEELRGQPVTILGADGKPTIAWDPIGQQWITRDGVAADPFDSRDGWKYGRGSRDPATGQILTDGGKPVARTYGEQVRRNNIDANKAFLDTPGGKLTKALNPYWREGD